MSNTVTSELESEATIMPAQLQPCNSIESPFLDPSAGTQGLHIRTRTTCLEEVYNATVISPFKTVSDSSNKMH